ncbi:(3S,6E)-nerolidol synthase 1-like isoform X1 [Olea europaea subsp. europaea]|uniref:(3S,6E)-nerolidol synthase 1-like isoform X1 n=1 Tax=Olea europaea subsp. europaea TaxID=158383 RepID=A0A8S0VCG0_OLEEU|nr:(3S,6E)-nerolidol synthase 1-like isoform X1 [Olea europaea subsp. europaea]
MLVDAIQRLDFDYHFQEEIEAVLRRHYMEATTSFDGYPLHDLSLFFRLFREHGFSISAGGGKTLELKQARNQPLKWYPWSMASLSDPSMSEQRLELTKSITFIDIIDDIFDLYWTPEELTVFTRAVHMWDYSVVPMLPKPMKLCYKALLDTTNDIGYKIYKKHGYDPIDSLKLAVR